jgi:hypothetical protein
VIRKWRDRKNMAAIWNSNLEVASTVINLQEAQHFCVIGIAEKVIVLPHQSYSENPVMMQQDVGFQRTTSMDLDENILRILSKTMVDDRVNTRMMVKV